MCADTNGIDRKEPQNTFIEPGEECEENGPNANEEDDDQDDDLQVLERAIPQGGPTLSTRLRGKELGDDNAVPSPTNLAQPVIAQHQPNGGRTNSEFEVSPDASEFASRLRLSHVKNSVSFTESEKRDG